jgi:hypothetical protein
MPTPPSGTVTNSGNMRTSNLGGFSGWGVFSAGGVTCDDTYAYALYSNVTNASINGGASECHLVRIPWATWTVAGATILRSFTRVTGSASAVNALTRRPSDGLLACRLNAGDLFTFDPAGGYSATHLGDGGGGATSSAIIGIAFDPSDSSVLWHVGYAYAARRWQIGTGDLGTTAYPLPAYTIQVAPDGRAVGAVAWDIAGSPKGIAVWDTPTGMTRFPAGLRWLDTQRDGAGSGNYTQTDFTLRAALNQVRDVCMDLDGRMYAVCATSAAFGIRTVTTDWLTVGSINTGSTPSGGSHIAVSPDGSKLVLSRGEELVRVT